MTYELKVPPIMGKYDVAVIGGGVVGCAVARRFSLEGAKVVLLESGGDILSGASKANSAILHTGFDAPQSSLELECMQTGYQEYMDIRAHLNLPILKTGAAVVAWDEYDEAQLDAIVVHAKANNVDDVEQISRSTLLRLEPALSAQARSAVLVPREYVIDPWSAPLAYVQQAMAHGASVMRQTEVTGGCLEGGIWQLTTTRGTLEVGTVINCAGLFGDLLEQKLLGETHFQIRPRKGQFVVFDKAAAKFIHRIILPVPSDYSKGIVLTRTVFGNLLVGPTAEEQEDRCDTKTEGGVLHKLVEAAVNRIPALAGMPVTATYAGLRPATERKEYRIKFISEHNWISVGGIRSTGLTASLGLARHIYGLYQQSHQHVPIAMPNWPQVPNLAEHEMRDWQQPGCGEIICHCEMVTLREIETAFSSLLPPKDLGGLRRRTRACMGRCQGFYCIARLAEISAGHFVVPLTVNTADG